MHDMSLGAPVDLGAYDGPLLEGKPLHLGSCEDGVYGCRSCNSAARRLTPDQLKAIGWPESDTCDWCHKDAPISDMRGLRPWDEPCYYEVCKSWPRKLRTITKCTTRINYQSSTITYP